MKILVTGASGFIGSNVCRYLKNQGHEVFPLCSNTCAVSDEFKDTSVFLGMFGFDTNVFKHIDGVVHLAANNDTVSKQASEMMNANYYDSKNLLKIAMKHGCEFFVYASSTAVYGNAGDVLNEEKKARPLNIYAKSKLKFDKFMEKNSPGIRWVGLRLCNIYGPGEMLKGRRASYLGQMMYKMLNNKPVELFEDGKQQRDWCYVQDVCQAFSKAIHTKQNGIFNIGSGESVSFNDLFSILSDATGYTEKPVWIPNEYKRQYQNFTQVDFTKATRFFNYTPEFNVKNGILEYLRCQI